MSAAPVNVEVSMPMQATVVAASYAIWLGLLVYSIFLGRKENTPFYAFVILAAGYGGFFEPIYDITLMLYFYRVGQWTLFTSFDIPQPVWVYSGYATLYGSVALFLTRDIHRGITRKGFFRYAIIELLSSCAFEMIVINGGIYEYWGPHVFRIFKYPICIGILETVQVMSFSIAAAYLRAYSTRILPLLGVFIIFPITFMAANIGAGAPLIIALHSSNESEALVTLGTLAAIVQAILTIWSLSYIIPGLEGGIALPRHTSNEEQSESA